MANRIEIDIVANDKTGAALDDLGTKLTGLGLTMTQLVTDPLMDLWKDLFKTDEMKEAMAPIKEAFDEVLGELVTALGPVIANLTPLLLGIADALSDLVQWFSELDEPVQMFIVGLVAVITVLGPLLVLIGAIIPVVTAAAAALGLPVAALLAIVAAVGALVTALIAFWPQISSWAQNVMAKFNEIKTNVVKAVTDAYNGIKSQVTAWFNAGKDLVMGLVNGVKAAASTLINAVRGVVDDAIQGAKNLLGISSPSKVFQEIGSNMMSGWAKGIQMNASPQFAIQNAAGGMVASAIPSGGRGGGVGNTIVVNYSPVVSLADRYEAETKLVPYIESALRKIR